MTTKELIYAEIDKLGTENLDELYEVVKQFAHVKATRSQTGALAQLKRIKIQGPEDFSANLDLYQSLKSPGFLKNPGLFF